MGALEVDTPAPRVARLTISNPAKRNALDRPILDALAETLPRLDARCVLLTGGGDVFSAGYDIGDLAPERLAEEASELIAHPFQNALEALDAVEIPIVAALNGHAIGGGLELALACDLRVLAPHAKLGMPPGRLGLVYSHTGRAPLPRRDRRGAHARAVPDRQADRRARRPRPGASSTRSRRDAARARAGARRAGRVAGAARRSAATSACCASCSTRRWTSASCASCTRCARARSARRTSPRACARSSRSATRSGGDDERPSSGCGSSGSSCPT